MIKIRFRGNDQWYEQYGVLHGVIKGSSFQTEDCLYFKSYRKRYWGKAECFSLKRDLSIYIAVNDGTLLNVGVKAFKNGCTK